MALENVAKFEDKLRADEALQTKVEGLYRAWDGDKGDRQAVFEAIVAPVAADAGLPFTYEELKASADSRDVDDAELEAVAGGMNSGCYVIGVSEKPEAKCPDHGYACAYIGIGF